MDVRKIRILQRVKFLRRYHPEEREKLNELLFKLRKINIDEYKRLSGENDGNKENNL
jgi:hypothetical protein